MTPDSIDALVKTVTEQVLKTLSQDHILSGGSVEGKSNALILGDPKDVPAPLAMDTVLLPIEDYERNHNILRYSKVIIAELSMVDLADLAIGRPGSSAVCAICQALLQGIEVLMLESALSYRKYVGKSSSGLYRVLEGHTTTLQTFGIKLVQSGSALMAVQPPSKKSVQRKELSDIHLLTEALAKKLVKEVQELVIPAGAIVTPSAMDVLKAANTTLVRK